MNQNELPHPDQQNKLASDPHVALACVCSLGTSIPLCRHLDGASEIRAFFAHFGWKYQMLYSLWHILTPYSIS